MFAPGSSINAGKHVLISVWSFFFDLLRDSFCAILFDLFMIGLRDCFAVSLDWHWHRNSSCLWHIHGVSPCCWCRFSSSSSSTVVVVVKLLLLLRLKSMLYYTGMLAKLWSVNPAATNIQTQNTMIQTANRDGVYLFLLLSSPSQWARILLLLLTLCVMQSSLTPALDLRTCWRWSPVEYSNVFRPNQGIIKASLLSRTGRVCKFRLQAIL